VPPDHVHAATEQGCRDSLVGTFPTDETFEIRPDDGLTDLRIARHGGHHIKIQTSDDDNIFDHNFYLGTPVDFWASPSVLLMDQNRGDSLPTINASAMQGPTR